jgi:DHA2 family multidrug resistance protein-like MFS transporter
MLLFSTSLLTSQYLQLVLGFEPLEAGLWQLPTAVGGSIVALWVSGLATRVQPAVLMSAGAAFAVLGPVMLTQVDDGPGFLVAGSLLLFAGLTPFMALGTGLVVGAAPTERAGAASAISETGAELGGALGIATLGSVAAAAYGSYMADHMPQGVPADLTGPAGETLPAALEAARQLPEELGSALTATARAAFTQSLHVHALILIPLLLALSGLTLTLRRREGQAPKNQASPDDRAADPAPVAD